MLTTAVSPGLLTRRSPSCCAARRRCPTSSPPPARSGWRGRSVSGELEIDGDIYTALSLLWIGQHRQPGLARPPRRAAQPRPEGAALGGSAGGGVRRSAGSSARLPALQGARRRGDQPPLRRLQPFYEWVLGPSMTYTCACYPTEDADAGGGAGPQVRPGLRASSGSSRGCACSTSAAAGAAWSVTPRSTTASTALGRDAVTAAGRVGGEGDRRGRAHRRRRGAVLATTATSSRSGFDAVSSIGLTEHIGLQSTAVLLQVPALQAASPAGGCSTTASPARPRPRASRARASSTGTSSPTASSKAVGTHRLGDAGQRVRGPPRGEPARALRARRCTAGATTSTPTGTRRSPRSARPGRSVWALYMAGSRLGFERRTIELHQVLGVHVGEKRRGRDAAAPRLGRLNRRGSRAARRRVALQAVGALRCDGGEQDGLAVTGPGEG